MLNGKFSKKAQRIDQTWRSALLPLIIIVAVLSILSPNFFTATNVANILQQTATYALLAIGMTFVIITGGIDLSQGSLLPIVCIITSVVLEKTGSVFLAISCGLLLGALSGLFSGVLIAYVNIPPFIMTMGMMNALRGVALLLTDAAAVSVSSERFRFLGTGKIVGIPVPVFIFVGVALIASLVLAYTSTGRAIYAVGSNQEAAQLSGVNVRAAKIKAYVFSGVCVAIGSIVYLARLGSAQPMAGQSFEMEAVAATIIGGTSIVGGEGGVIGSVLGAIVMSVIRNGMVMLRVSTYWQQVVLGIIVIVAVIIDLIRKRMEASRNN